MAEAQDKAPIGFRYRARDASGGRKTGTLTAASRDEVRRMLRAQGLFPVEISEVGRPDPAPVTIKALHPAKSDSVHALNAARTARVISALSRLVSQQVTLERALGILAESDDRQVAIVADQLKRQVREGMALSDALPNHAGISDPATLALIRGGEVSGELGRSLEAAAQILETRAALGQKLWTGLLYPAVLLTVALISLGLILIVIIPQFRPLVEDRFDLIPFLGRSVFRLAGLLEAIWPILLTGLVLVGCVSVILARSGKLAGIAAQIARRTPLIGPIIQTNRAGLSLHILGALISRDVPLSQALGVLNRTPLDPESTPRLKSATRKVETGQLLSRAFADENLAPRAAIEMIRIGEETGELGPMLIRASDTIRDIGDRQMQRFLIVFEPLLIVFVGLIMGVSLYALFSAIISVNSISF